MWIKLLLRNLLIVLFLFGGVLFIIWYGLIRN